LVSQLKTAALKNRRVQDLILHPVVWITIALIIGAFIGSQAMGPASQRYIKLGIVLAFLYVVVRYPMYISTGLFMMIYTLPTILWFGDTNTLLIFILTIAWVIKYGMRMENPPQKTFLDWFIFVYILVHIASMYQIETTVQLIKTLRALTHLLMPIFVFYIIVNGARSKHRLLVLTEVFTASMVFVLITAIMEKYFPSVRYLPEWYLSFEGQELFGEEGAHRAMGIFRTHGLLSDACAISVIIQIYLASYFSGRPWLRFYHGVVAMMSLVILMMTGNRGGIIVLVMGLVHFLWVFRKGLSFSKVFSGTVLIIAGITVTELVLSGEKGNVTLLTRLAETEFTNFIPDTRRGLWPYIWDHILEKPLTGYGAYFDIDYFRTVKGRIAWPHNSYLFYFLTVGIFGLLFYLAMVVRLVVKTMPGHGLSLARTSLAHGLMAVYHINVVQFLVSELRTDHQRPNVRAMYMWFLYALLVLAYYIWKRERQDAPKVPLSGR
jgi:O-antigen ligase